MFPGKTEVEEFISHLESEYNEKPYSIGGKDFTFKIQDGISIFEYELGGTSEQPEQQNEEEEQIDFNSKSLNITIDLFAGNSNYTICTLRFIDEGKRINKVLKLKTTDYKLTGDKFTDSKNFFEVSEKKIRGLIKKLSNILRKNK